MVTVGLRGGRSVGRQVLRGIGFFVYGVSGLLAVLTLVSWVHADDDGRAGLVRRLAATAVVLSLGVVVALTMRSLRRWEGRPRWLVPAASVLLVVALVPAVYAPAPITSSSDGCIPVLGAWEPVVAEPSAADLAFYESLFGQPHPKTRAEADAQVAVARAKRRSPAYQRVENYGLWAQSDAGCAPSSRTHLGWSAAGLGVGAAALTVAVRRRRTG